MPVVQPGSRVLVTGATGFIAAWIIHTLLQRGFRVRGSVRSDAKGRDLQVIFKKFGDKFEYIIVEDMQKDGAFENAIKDMDAVHHVASPTTLAADDPEELIGPAVKGTQGILETIVKHGSSVKRVVVTSSAVALPHAPTSSDLPQKFTENDWNESSPKVVKELGKAAPAEDKYRASKVLAEKAAWEFVENNKGRIEWDLVTLVPPWVFGPILHKASSPSNLGFSCAYFYKIITNEMSLSETQLTQPYTNAHYVDVRDIAEAHVNALVVEKAGGQRFIVSAGVWTWQDFIDGLSTSPLASSLPKLPKGIPGAGKSAKHGLDYDSSKVKSVLGLRFRALEETARDTAQSFKERGWLG